jgi:hypothetical protein
MGRPHRPAKPPHSRKRSCASIFHLQINRAAPRLYTVHGEKDLALPNGRATATRLATRPEPSALLASPDAASGPMDMSSSFTIGNDDGDRGA